MAIKHSIGICSDITPALILGQTLAPKCCDKAKFFEEESKKIDISGIRKKWLDLYYG